MEKEGEKDKQQIICFKIRDINYTGEPVGMIDPCFRQTLLCAGYVYEYSRVIYQPSAVSRCEFPPPVEGDDM